MAQTNFTPKKFCFLVCYPHPFLVVKKRGGSIMPSKGHVEGGAKHECAARVPLSKIY